MPLTPNLSLNRPPHGDYDNTWDQPVNQNWDIIDGLFSGSTPPGHKHNGAAGMGPKIDHTDLLTIGVKTHAELDASFEKVMVSASDTTPNYLEPKIVAGANTIITKLNSPGNEQLQIASSGGGSPWVDEDEYGTKHTVPTSAPVAYTDNFTYPPGFSLLQADYTVARSSAPAGSPLPNFFTTGYSSVIYIDPTQGDDPIGKYAATVTCQTPHGPAQRATCSITDIDYSNLEDGDYVAFTLSLFSTHRLGTVLPQKHGVMLEIHLVKLSTGPDVFQVSHRLMVLPDASTQVLLWSHQHSDPDDMKGAWEISLDANGHVYHYWRRKLVHSTQASPPSTVGPVQAYFATLMASLLADTDEKYGAMGFGFHYGISPLSKFNFEFRWLTVAADSDIYDETPVCPGTADPYGIVSNWDLPKEFFLIPSVIPDDVCCASPSLIKVGDVLETHPITGDPTVWVTESAVMPEYMDSTGSQSGFRTNTSPHGHPCVAPNLDPAGITIYDLTGNWPATGPIAGTSGKVVIHGVNDLPPLLKVLTANPYFIIIDVVWLDHFEFEIKYEILEDGGGTDIDLEISNAVSPARTLIIPILAAIQDAPSEILSIEWLDSYRYALVDPTAGYRFEAILTGTGFTGATLISPTVGVTIHSFTVDSATQITADIEFDFLPMRGMPFTLSVGGPTDYTGTAGYPTQLVSYVEFTAPAAPDGPTIATGKAVTIHGNFFGVGALTITPVDPTQVSGGIFTVGLVTPTSIALTFDIIALGTATPLLEVSILDNDSGQSITVPICVINDVALLSVGSVTPTPVSILTARRKPTPSGYPPYTFDTVVSGGMNASCYVLLSGPVAGPLYGTPGDSHTISRGIAGLEGEFWNECGDIGAVDITILKPGVDVKAILSGFSTADPTPPIVSGVPFFSTLPEPGAFGTVDFPFSSYSYLTEYTTISQAGITLTNWSDVGTGIRYDFAIAADVPSDILVTIEFADGPCDPGPAPTTTFTTEYVPPVITDVIGTFYETVQNYVCVVKGTGFDGSGPGTTINISGNATYVSHVDVDSETIELTLHLGAPGVGAASIEVENPDTKTSNVFPITIATEVAADVDHTDMEPSTTGVSSTLYIYGAYLNPPGASLNFNGFTPSGPPTYHNDSYIEQDGTITAPAAGDVTLDITSTAHVYNGLFLAKATASPGGAVVIHSISLREPKEDESSFETTVFGENLDLIFSVEATPTDPDRLALDYQPIGPTPAVTVLIVSKTVDHILLRVALEDGLAYNAFDFLFYDGVELVATAPAAIEAQPATFAPDISKATRTILDGSGLDGAGVSWSIAIPTSEVFGDMILAPSGWTIDGIPSYVGGQWLISGTNVAGVGVDWELVIDSPARSSRAVYRVPGGVTT